MKLAFDEHVPIGIAKVFKILASEGATMPVTEVVGAREYAEPEDGGDDQHWVRRFARDGGKVIVSGDKKMRGRPHERKALIDEGMIVFFFTPTWSGKNGFVKSAMLLNWWPKIAEVSRQASSSTLWQIPFQWTWDNLEQIKVPSDAK